MKKYIGCGLTLLSLVGCMNTTETPEQIEHRTKILAQELAQDLETTKDPVMIMEAYIKYFQNNISCDEYAGKILCKGTELPNNSHIAEALAEPGTKYECLTGYYCIPIAPDMHISCSGGSQSDECIVYRRKLHETNVAYFDYKRFLEKDTRIKDDATFLRFAHAYNKNAGCETEKETTSLEKQGCKERRDNFFRQAVKQKIHCRDFVESEYRKWLKDALYTYNSWKQDWKYSHEEAMEQVKEKADSFSKMYLCDVSGWQKEIFK